MGQEGTEKRKPTTPSYYPKYTPPAYTPKTGGWGGQLLPEVEETNYYTPSKYASTDTKQIDILIRIPMKDMISVTDFYDPKYDYQAASLEAEEIAYDKLVELLGKEFESKYTSTFDTMEGVTFYEVTAFLVPVK